MITFKDVLDYREDIKDDLETALKKFEKHIKAKTNFGGLPHCIVRWRIKSAQSIYKKTKIKELLSVDDLNDKINDYAGIRFLALFEDDLMLLHKYILHYLKKNKFSLKEFTPFNWTDNARTSVLIKEIEKIFVDVDSEGLGETYKYLPSNPDSGYRSLHYLVKHVTGYYIEIQLRTYLQDVWGELEHSVVYKQGHINPFIKESFVKLAEELSIKDKNVQYLQQISTKEKTFNRVVRKSETLCPYFTHNKFLLNSDSVLNEQYNTYIGHAKAGWGNGDKQEWVDKGKLLLKELNHLVKADDPDNHDKKHLWYCTERAYWYFQEGFIDKAREYYSMAENIRDNLGIEWGYSINLRIAESYSMEGDIDNALIHFDKSESLIPEDISGEEESIYQLRNILAYHYWMLGPDFYHIAVKKIKLAIDVYEKNKNKIKFDANSERRNSNNLCWYQLEYCMKLYQRIKMINSLREDDIVDSVRDKIKDEREVFDQQKKETRNNMDNLIRLLGEDCPSNSYDTVAWGSYNLYLVDQDEEDLKKAVKYAMALLGHTTNESKQKNISIALQKSHFQEIMHTANEKGLKVC